jgi:membrane peptidoglycan carboxypeptidase
VLSMAKKAGVDSPLRPFPATYLGSSEVTLMEMTLANTIFPNQGWRPEKPFLIQKIEEKGGRVIFEAQVSKIQVIKPTTAYEIHSCLAEVLERGTADKAYTELGLKRFPLGGKTGTAYNFTDAWFVGYSSAVTCGVWAGFDKPEPIYRGAFSNEIALPVWANVMKETFAKYRPEEIREPKGIIKCELCAASGLLATDKCFETVENKETGEKVQRRTTYFEICTEDQAPKIPCNIHGGGAVANVSPALNIPPPQRVAPGEQAIPRAVAVGNFASIRPVLMKSPTVLGADPYNSDRSVTNAIALKAFAGQNAPLDSSVNIPAPRASTGDQIEVRRAIPNRPSELQGAAQEIPIKIDPPPPLEF